MTLVERKSGFTFLAKVPNKLADLVGRAIETKLKPLISRVKKLTVYNVKQFADRYKIDKTLGLKTFLPILMV